MMQGAQQFVQPGMQAYPIMHQRVMMPGQMMPRGVSLQVCSVVGGGCVQLWEGDVYSLGGTCVYSNWVCSLEIQVCAVGMDTDV
jgi:hypothetical protein